jgi:hypothetical protein
MTTKLGEIRPYAECRAEVIISPIFPPQPQPTEKKRE